MLRTFAIASLGGMLEFYDFIIFVFFTDAIGRAFFPPELPGWLKQTEVFGLFAAGYLARPLGGVAMAHFGDRSGRKRMFMLGMLLMALATLLIGAIPGYDRLGYAAPCLLLACRLIQGAAVGGEVPGAWVFVSEHAPGDRVGLACGLLTGGLTLGIFLGSMANAAINLGFTQAAIQDYAWRIPFLAGGLLGAAGMLLRRRLSETPVFEALRREARLAEEWPVGTVVREHGRGVLVSMLATWLLTAVIVVLILMAPTLLRQSTGIGAPLIALAGLAATAALSAGCVAAGLAIDRFGLRRMIPISAAAIIAAAYLLFAGATRPDLIVPIYAVVGAASGLITFVPIVMVRAFPAPIRFSGVSLSYNAAYAVAGGLTPPAAAYLSHVNGLAPAHYVAFVSAVSLVAIPAASAWHDDGRFRRIASACPDAGGANHGPSDPRAASGPLPRRDLS